MEKLDRVVALVGALVLAGAVGYAATAREGAGQEYALVYVPLELELPTVGFPSGLPSTGGSANADMTLTGNVSQVEIEISLTATSPTEGSFRAVLTAPNGTVVHEQEVTVPAASQQPVTLKLVGFVQPVPESVQRPFASQEEAEAALVAADANGTGEWKLEYAYSPGLVPAAAGMSMAHEARALLWTAVATPITPEGK